MIRARPESLAGQGVGSGPVRRALLGLLWLCVAFLTLTASYSLYAWQRDLGQIREILSERVDPAAEPDEIIATVRDFFEHEVGYERPDSFFLAPMFSFMRPTALQVIRAGGDCAYRTRAFVVTLGLYDIEASKIALHDDSGLPVHAVAEVRTDDGWEYIDMLYNIAHRDSTGAPLALDQLERLEVLGASVERAAMAGNERATRYPLAEYNFKDWRTINWEKNALLSMSYDVLVGLMGEERARRFPRPYLSEEPALMVVVLCTGGLAICLILIVGIGRVGRGRGLSAGTEVLS